MKDHKESETEKFITHRSGRRFAARRGAAAVQACEAAGRGARACNRVRGWSVSRAPGWLGHLEPKSHHFGKLRGSFI